MLGGRLTRFGSLRVLLMDSYAVYVRKRNKPPATDAAKGPRRGSTTTFRPFGGRLLLLSDLVGHRKTSREIGDFLAQRCQFRRVGAGVESPVDVVGDGHEVGFEQPARRQGGGS